MPEVTRQQIIEAALSYVGTPYKAGGSDADGMSCAGLLVAIGRDTGYLEEEIPGFSAFNEAEPLREWFDKYLDEIPRDERLPGDVVSCEFSDGDQKTEQHCAVLVEKSERGIKYDYFVHALRNHGVRKGRLFGVYLANVKAAYRLRGLVDD